MKAMVSLIISNMLLFTFCSMNYSGDKVSAKLDYFNNSINLQIINNSEDSIYYPVKDFSSLTVLFNHKRIKDLYISNLNELAMIEAELKILISKKHPKAYSWNYEKPLFVDSVLFEYFIDEFKKINKLAAFDSTNEQVIGSYITTVFNLEGGFLFLRPKEVYSRVFKCGSLDKIGKYEVNYKEKKRKYLSKSVAITDKPSSNKYRIPIIPPSILLGFKRYDGQVIAEKLVLNNLK